MDSIEYQLNTFESEIKAEECVFSTLGGSDDLIQAISTLQIAIYLDLNQLFSNQLEHVIKMLLTYRIS